jgi:DNA-binding NarL/FixJ family response regulator
MAAGGSMNKAIALGLNESTVESSLGNAFAKMGARLRLEAVPRAPDESLIVLPD